MKKSEGIKNIAGALVKFQKEIENPKNTARNSFFKSKYAPLNEIINHVKPMLTKNGLSYIQNVAGDGDSITVTTVLFHESGEWIESEPLTIENQENKGVSKAQGAGIAITYARRYSLSAILGISSEDDNDGNYHKEKTTEKNRNNKPIENPNNCTKEFKMDEQTYIALRQLFKQSNEAQGIAKLYLQDCNLKVWEGINELTEQQAQKLLLKMKEEVQRNIAKQQAS